MNDLNACQSKEDLLRLAVISIRISPSQRGLEERLEQGLSKDPAIINMISARAHLNAKIGRDFGGTNAKLAMIMAKYAKFAKGSPKHFVEDFKQSFLPEFTQRGEQKHKQETVQKSQINLALLRKRAEYM